MELYIEMTGNNRDTRRILARERNHSEYLGIDGRRILKTNLPEVRWGVEWVVVACNGARSRFLWNVIL